jgi:hypothetical protein
VCVKPPEVSDFPPLLADLTSVQITSGDKDSILLAGSFSSADYYPTRSFERQGTGAGPSLILNPDSLAMRRLGADPASVPDDEARLAIVAGLFRTGRAVRIVDRSGRHFYGVVSAVSMRDDDAPEIQLNPTPNIPGQAAGRFCGMDQCTGCAVNVVNFIRYDVAKVSADNYGPLYSDAGAAPFDDARTELRRRELDVAGAEMAGTEELVAQYAVDLKFGLLVERVSPGVKEIQAINFGETDDIEDFAAPPPATAQLIRGVRVRLGVRTRDADRESDLDPVAQGLPPGLYRVELDAKHFARVRTLQADVMLNNVTSISWSP